MERFGMQETVAEARVSVPLTTVLHRSAIRVLEYIQGNPGCTAGQAGGALGLHKATVSHHVATLVALGLVKQERSEHDRREWHLRAREGGAQGGWP